MQVTKSALRMPSAVFRYLAPVRLTVRSLTSSAFALSLASTSEGSFAGSALLSDSEVLSSEVACSEYCRLRRRDQRAEVWAATGLEMDRAAREDDLQERRAWSEEVAKFIAKGGCDDEVTR